MTIFGSVARKTDTEKSDIDLFLDFGFNKPTTSKLLKAEGKIIEAFGYIQRYAEGFDQSSFLIDRKTQDAVSMRLQQILECATKLSPETKEQLKID